MLTDQAGSSNYYYYLKTIIWVLLLCLSLFFFLSSFYCMKGMLASLAAFPLLVKIIFCMQDILTI